jgi:hypothetical protein
MSNAPQEPTVHGRAWIAPTGTRSLYENESNVSADSAVRCHVHLTALSAADGGPVDPTLTKLEARLPNWLRYVFHSAGATDELSKQLPPRIEVNVAIGVQSRRCVAIDVDGAVRDLQPFRAAAVDDWKHSEAALAPVRNLLSAPKAGLKALRGLKGGLKDLVGDIKDIGASGPGPGGGAAPKPSWKPDEIDAMHRQAAILALRYQTRPEEYARARNMAVQSLPSHAQQAAAGQIHRADFDAMLRRELIATTISQQEADEYQRMSQPAATPPPPTSPPTSPTTPPPPPSSFPPPTPGA